MKKDVNKKMYSYPKKKAFVVYMIECKINNKKYIGSTNRLVDRKSYHRLALKRNTHKNKYLQKEYNKFKKLKFFKFAILEICNKSVINFKHLRKREQFYMDKYKSYDRKFGYNICPKADGSKLALESRISLSKSRKGMKFSEEHKKNMSLSRTGMKFSKEILERKSQNTRKYKRLVDEWSVLRGQGMSYAKIGKIYSVSDTVVHKYLTVFYPEKCSNNKYAEKRKYLHFIEEWKKLKSQGYSLRRIGKMYNINENIIYSYNKKYLCEEI